MTSIDVAVIGAGPIGLSVGIALEKKGLSYVIFDKGLNGHELENTPDVLPLRFLKFFISVHDHTTIVITHIRKGFMRHQTS